MRSVLPTVKFDKDSVTSEIRHDLSVNVSTLSDIDQSQHDAVYRAALTALLSGGDLYTCSLSLAALGIQQKRASTISRVLWFQSSALIQRNRYLSLGVLQSRWRYSGAPCFFDRSFTNEHDKVRNLKHKLCGGQIYSTRDGMNVNGIWTYPGREHGCKCSFAAVIPGVSD